MALQAVAKDIEARAAVILANKDDHTRFTKIVPIGTKRYTTDSLCIDVMCMENVLYGGLYYLMYCSFRACSNVQRIGGATLLQSSVSIVGCPSAAI